jgi:Protein of unknown function (DUF2505)
VAQKVQYEMVYAADPGFVMDTLVDEAFLAAYAKEIGALDWDIGVDQQQDLTRSRLLMHVPTQGIPVIFRRLLPETLEIVETRTWPSATRGKGEVAVDAAVAKRDARVRGQLLLGTVDGGTRFEMSGDVSVSLPLVGDRAAAQLKDLIVRVLGNQSTVMNRWIESGGVS